MARADAAGLEVTRLSHEVEVLHAEVEKDHAVEKALEMKIQGASTGVERLEAAVKSLQDEKVILLLLL